MCQSPCISSCVCVCVFLLLVARQCSIFDDHAVEIQELTQIVKEVSKLERRGGWGGGGGRKRDGVGERIKRGGER